MASDCSGQQAGKHVASFESCVQRILSHTNAPRGRAVGVTRCCRRSAINGEADHSDRSMCSGESIAQADTGVVLSYIDPTSVVIA